MINQSKNCTCCFNIFTHCVAEILPKKHSCPPNWTSFGSSCYLVNPNPKSYKDAAVSSIATYFLNNHSSCYTMRTLLKVSLSLSLSLSRFITIIRSLVLCETPQLQQQNEDYHEHKTVYCETILFL